MKDKYCKGKHSLPCAFKKGDSTLWKRISLVKWDMESLIHWGLGMGSCYFWQDNWIFAYS